MDVEREAWMVRELAGYLADTQDQSSVSLLAQGISTTNKVYMIRDDADRPILDLRLPYERAWASLGRAIERGGFVANDLNRDAGVYYVTYDPAATDEEDDDSGIMDALFGWWGDSDADENVWIGRAYRVHVQQAEEGVTIKIETETGAAFDAGEAEFILSVIKANLA